MLNRRHFHQLALLPLASLVGVEACFQSARSPIPTEEREAAWESIETTSGGRLGVAIFDSANGAWTGHRIDERFPMCSTFKWLAAAYVLHRVDRGQEKLDRRIRYGSDEGQEFAAQVMEFVRYHCMQKSIELAEARGPFLAFSGSIYDSERRLHPPTAAAKGAP
ncbi:MAG TPA: serine hydrolase [Polyangiaceae bacterium]|nr:serine hydrolase [Polyangiaceae bacterium]